MKLFLNNIKNNSKKISLKNDLTTVGKVKVLPSFSKEWKSTVYSYNKNLIKNMANDNLNLDNIIKSYFNLYFKQDTKYLTNKWKLRILRNKQKSFSKIFVSNAEIKHSNRKAKVTLYIVNREKVVTKNKYFILNQLFMKHKLNKYYSNLYNKKIVKLYNIFNNYKHNNMFLSTMISKQKFIAYKLEYLNKFINLKQSYLEMTFERLLIIILKKYITTIRKFERKHSLNQYKLNQFKLLPNLSHILYNLIGKKIEYNIVNLKSLTYNSDIFTNILGSFIRKKRTIRLAKSMALILKKVRLPIANSVQERTSKKFHNKDVVLNNYKNSRLISNLSNNLNINDLLDQYNELNKKNNQINETIFNNINFKKLEGIRIEVKGRLTKRYRADRALYRYRSKGGLRNIHSSYQGLSSVLFRGNTNSNTSYSCFKSKRRIGAFAVKGWIGGK